MGLMGDEQPTRITDNVRFKPTSIATDALNSYFVARGYAAPATVGKNCVLPLWQVMLALVDSQQVLLLDCFEDNVIEFVV